MSQVIIVGNWKMHGSRAHIDEFASAWSISNSKAEVVLAPPSAYLSALAAAMPAMSLAAQDCSAHNGGAYTGEVSAAMLADLGVGWVILGHSERRQYHAETDALVAEKLNAALGAGVRPIVCVGETLAQRESGEHEAVVASQVLGSLASADLTNVVIAYEPVWAIGTGVTATPEQANEMHGAIRALLVEHFGETGANIPLLYGGSVKPGNAAELFACEYIDGALVGGASLKAEDFAAIVGAA